jgi:dolichol-phosphate mannosyltransferase
VTGRLTEVHLRDFNPAQGVPREVVEGSRLYGELHRFIRPRRGGVPVDGSRFVTAPALRALSSLRRFWRGCLDLVTVLFLTRYTRRPLHLFGGLGLAAWVVGLGANLYLTGLWLTGVRPIGTRPLLAFGVLSMLVGIQFFAIGLLSELVLSYQTKSADDVSIRGRLG